MTSTIRYRSPFHRWEERAAVRAAPLAGPGRSGGGGRGDWFPASGSCVADHPEVVAAGRRDRVLAALLLGYLDFTFHLEALCIAPTSCDIAVRRIGADYDAELARDAIRVQCDEAFHALMCAELADHVISTVGLDRGNFPEHAFIRAARELAPRAAATLTPEQYAFCVAVVSETVITDSLQKDWQEGTLRPEVREVLLAHYKDEVRHSAFFSQALRVVWPQWSKAAQDAMAPLWSALVLAFIRIDPEVTAFALILAGFSDGDARRIVAESLGAEGAAAERGASYKLTLRVLHEAGVLGSDDAYRRLADRLSPPSPDRLSSRVPAT